MTKNLKCYIVAEPDTADISFDRLISEAMIMSIELDMKVVFKCDGKTYTVDYESWIQSILGEAK